MYGYVPIYSMRDKRSDTVIRMYISVLSGDGLILHVRSNGCVDMAYEFTKFSKVKIRGA